MRRPPSGATDSKDSASSSRNLSFFPADFVPGKYVIVTMSTYPSLRAIEIKTSIYLCRLIVGSVHGFSKPNSFFVHCCSSIERLFFILVIPVGM